MAEAAPKRQKLQGEEETGVTAEDDFGEEFNKIKQELEKLNEEASEKVLDIEQQYSKLRRPIYDRRGQILKGIPQFWQTAIMHHPEFRDAATNDDAKVLAYCTELDVQDFEDIKSGYRIIFRFAPDNPYFSNSELVKTYTYQPGGTLKIESTKPLWKEGYEPEEEEEDEDEEGNDEGKRRRSNDYRFFNWFNTDDEVVQPPATDDIADIIKEDIWPDPVKYYEMEEEEPVEFDFEEELEGEEIDEGEGEEALAGGEGEEGFEIAEGEEGDE